MSNLACLRRAHAWRAHARRAHARCTHIRCAHGKGPYYIVSLFTSIHSMYYYYNSNTTIYYVVMLRTYCTNTTMYCTSCLL